MRKNIQIGISDFKKLIEGNNYFVDKSLLIKEFIENGADTILTPRPRRFGKTLNLSMLRYFFDIRTKDDTKDLFKNLKIENEKEIMELQGQYPVIFITFKNEKPLNYEEFINGMRNLISNLYRDHEYLLSSNKLTENDKRKYEKFLNEEANIASLQNGVSELMYYLNKHYGKKVMLFIDEYDVPIQEGYLREKGNPTHMRSLGTFEEPNTRFGLSQHDDMIIVIRNLLTAALKDNQYVEKALITGILRVARESIFSGLNNLQINTILGFKFNDKFGFTEEELKELWDYYNLKEKSEDIKTWYNGYVFGGKTIYNPWSVLNYIDNNEVGFMPYWINSSNNDLIKRLLIKGDKDMKLELEELIEGKSIIKVIDVSLVMSEVEDSNKNIWSFLLMSGYLKAVNTQNIEGRLNCELKIPNKEVLIFYKNLIEKWFQETMTNQKYELMLNMLINGEIEIFSGIFKQFVINNLSYFDVSGTEPERVYHAFVLGMLISLSEKYEVKSNKESGYGRYDVMLIPKDISKIGIVIEFKKIDDFLKTTIEEGSKAALKQIEDMKYSQELISLGIKNIVKLAIVFKGKEIEITQEDN